MIYTLVIAAVWHASGLVMAIMLAGLRGIDAESGRPRGSTAFRPGGSISPSSCRCCGASFATAIVLLATSVVRLYDLSVAMTNGGPGIASEVPAKFVMDHLFDRGNVGLATAAATIHADHGCRSRRAVALLAEPARGGEVAGMTAASHQPSGRRPRRLTPARVGVYAFLVISALFFLMPLYVMLVTSLKTHGRNPAGLHPGAGRMRRRFSPGSRRGPRPAPGFTATASASASSIRCDPDPLRDRLDRRRRADRLRAVVLAGARRGLLFGTLIVGRLHPLSGLHLSAGADVLPRRHQQFAARHCHHSHDLRPADYDADLPQSFRLAAGGTVQGRTRRRRQASGGSSGAIMLPMATPIIVVAVILQVTGIWNDFIFGLVFAGRENLPMTVQLNNIVNSTQGERDYNVDMAATLLTALVPLVVYFVSGRWFVRGIAAGAVKG